MSREHTEHLKSNVPCGTISGRGLSVVITRRGLMMKFLIPKHAEAYYFPVRVCTLPLPALPFPILLFSQPSHVQHSLAAGRWRAPRQKKAVKNNSRSWQRKVMVKGWNGILPRVSVWHVDDSKCPRVTYVGRRENKVGSPDTEEPQFTSSLSKKLGALLFPSQAECFPKEPGNQTRMCATPMGIWNKRKTRKETSLHVPSSEGHSFWEAERILLKWCFLGLWEGTNQWILRSNDKRRVLGLWSFVGTFDIHHEKGNGNH